MADIEVNPAAHTAELEARHAPIVRPEHAEGPITRIIEQQTAKLPSSFFLLAALGAMTASAVLELRGRRRLSAFVGLWPPTLMMAGIYNKLIKTIGSR